MRKREVRSGDREQFVGSAALKPAAPEPPKTWQQGRNNAGHRAGKLTEEERAARLAAMQADADKHEEARWARLKRQREEEPKDRAPPASSPPLTHASRTNTPQRPFPDAPNGRPCPPCPRRVPGAIRPRAPPQREAGVPRGEGARALRCGSAAPLIPSPRCPPALCFFLERASSAADACVWLGGLPCVGAGGASGVQTLAERVGARKHYQERGGGGERNAFTR